MATENKLLSPLLAATAGLLFFEALTGAALTFAGRLSEWLQWALLLHVGLGIVFMAVYAVYQTRHYLDVRSSDERRAKAMGLLVFATLVVCLLTGVWETVEAALGSRVTDWVRSTHTVTGYLSAFLVLVHLIVVLKKLGGEEGRRGGAFRWPTGTRGLAFRVGGICAASAAILAAACLLTPEPSLRDGSPDGYSLKYGPDPFAPSNAATTTGGVLDHRRMSGSKKCAYCHEEIYKEWEASAHRWSSTDPFYRAVEDIMIKEEGREATRYCAACHDPVALLSGAVDPAGDIDSPGADEGSSCLFCHGIVSNREKTKGNGNYVFSPPPRYLFAHEEGPWAEKVNRFLVWSYPRFHTRSLANDFQATAEFCATCHKQYIDKKINNFGWVQLQNQYDNWRNGRFHVEGSPEKTITCMECHMRLEPSEDPARGKEEDPARGRDGKHRSHRFIAANQAIPWLNGDAEQVRLTEEWLRGHSSIPEIAHKWTEGPAVPVRIEMLEPVRGGGRLRWRVVVTNNKVGHNFPTGPMDLIESWLEVKAVDSAGRVLHHSGFLDGKNYVDKEAFFFRAVGTDRHGEIIDRHNLWDMVGQKYKRAIFSGYSDSAAYEARIPPGAAGEVTISARLRYRKFNQFITDLVFGKEKKIFPITDISSHAVTVPLGRVSGR